VGPEAIALDILYQDSDLIVVDKPAGMVVHPAPGHPGGTLVNALLHHCSDLAGVGGVLRPGIVHRLDQGTSGVMVAAKNDLTHRGLADQFHDHSIERLYRAAVRSVPSADHGRVDRPIGRHLRDRKRMSVRSRSGRPAATRWRVIERFPASRAAWLEIHPETGRTHQIRVHLASIGLPICGDPVYGRARKPRNSGFGRLGRPALHAARLGFSHPRSGESMRFEAPLPADLVDLLARLRGKEA
jgi:23S rRNA pseudouridine1911/1915/1917 synthase